VKYSVFEYRDYKKYVTDTLENRSETSRGERSRLAEALQCHTAYVSQVLNGSPHFSLEQADRINQFFGHNKEQSLYFLLIVQHSRAGTASLKKVFDDQIQNIIERQYNLKNRLEFKKTLSVADQALFYSSWHYGAIHVLVSVPGCHTERGISDYLGLPIERVSEILSFLSSIGLVKKESGGRYEIGTTHIHLGADSPNIAKHHSNWRIRGIQSLDQPLPNDLHYSSVVTVSEEDAPKIRACLVKAIEEIRKTIKGSKDEGAYCYLIDFFNLKSKI